MSSKEEMISSDDVERIPELQTPGTDITTNNNNQASSSFVFRRPRGRPPSSKNKPKIPTIETLVNRNALSSHVLEITHGVDVSTILFEYARREGRGICILNGNGVVARATLRQSIGRILSLMGRFKILLIFGTILPSSSSARELTVFLSNTTGQEFGGSVIPPLMAFGIVILMVASFANTTFEKPCLVK